MSDTPTTSASSLFETITGRKRKRATPKGCDGRPALNGSKAPTYLTDEDGNVKRLGRRDVEDIPNNTLVLRYHGAGRPDPSTLTEDQRKGTAPLPKGWEFVPVFAHAAGKRRGQVLHEYGLKDIEHTGLHLDFDMALDAWMRASAQDPSVATRDHLLFTVLLHNTDTYAEVTGIDPRYFDPRNMNPPSLETTKALIAALDSYDLRDRVSSQSFSLLTNRVHGLEADYEMDLLVQLTHNLHKFINVAADLDALENRTVAQWLADDFLLIDKNTAPRQEPLSSGDRLRFRQDGALSWGKPSLLTPREVAGRVELYERWHRVTTNSPEFTGLITAFREGSMRGGHRGNVGGLDDFIERYQSGDYEASCILDVIDDMLKDGKDIDLNMALRNANYMLRGWPMHEISAREISTALRSPQIGSILSTHANQDAPVSIQAVKSVFFANKITHHCDLTLRDVVTLSEETPFSPAAFEQLVVQASHIASEQASFNKVGLTKALLDLTHTVTKELEADGISNDTVALTAAAVFQYPRIPEYAGGVNIDSGFEALRAQLTSEAIEVHAGRKTIAQVAVDGTHDAPKLRYGIAVGNEIGPAPTYGVEWTRPVQLGKPLLGNIDPQHDNGRDTRAAIEAALDAPLPPRGVTLQTVRADLDAFGAMAILSARASGEDLSATELRARVAVIAAADRREDLSTAWAPKPYDPEHIDNPEIVGLSRTIRELSPQDAVVELGSWLRTGALPTSAERVVQERLASQRQMAERYAEQKASGVATVRGSSVPWVAAGDVAPDVVYSEAPVAVLSKDTGSGFKHTVAVHPGFEWKVSPELVAALNAREAELGGTPEWGGPNTGKLLGSPQKGNSRIDQDEFREICSRFIN